MADKTNDHGLDYEGGFLSETQREYLAENTDKTLEDYSNPHTWYGRVETQYTGALMDLALMGSSDEIDSQKMRESAQTKLNQEGWVFKENAPIVGKHAAMGIASSYDNGELMQLINPMEDVAREVRQRRDFTQRFLVKAILSVLENGNPSDDEVLEFLGKYWPDREEVLEIAESELSDD